MFLLIVLVLLLAAMTGVFWTVLKITAAAILTTILTIALLAWIGVWYVRRRFRRFVRGYDREMERRRAASRGRPGIDAPGWKHPDEELPGPGPTERQPPL